MPHQPHENEDLRRALAEAEAAEAKLRQLKERLIPRDRAVALKELMRAELSAMVACESAKYESAILAAKTEEEARDVLKRMSEAMAAGTGRVTTEMLSQMQAWTVAGLEDRATEDENL